MRIKTLSGALAVGLSIGWVAPQIATANEFAIVAIDEADNLPKWTLAKEAATANIRDRGKTRSFTNNTDRTLRVLRYNPNDKVMGIGLKTETVGKGASIEIPTGIWSWKVFEAGAGFLGADVHRGTFKKLGGNITASGGMSNLKLGQDKSHITAFHNRADFAIRILIYNKNDRVQAVARKSYKIEPGTTVYAGGTNELPAQFKYTVERGNFIAGFSEEFLINQGPVNAGSEIYFGDTPNLPWKLADADGSPPTLGGSLSIATFGREYDRSNTPQNEFTGDTPSAASVRYAVRSGQTHLGAFRVSQGTIHGETDSSLARRGKSYDFISFGSKVLTLPSEAKSPASLVTLPAKKSAMNSVTGLANVTTHYFARSKNDELLETTNSGRDWNKVPNAGKTVSGIGTHTTVMEGEVVLLIAFRKSDSVLRRGMYTPSTKKWVFVDTDFACRGTPAIIQTRESNGATFDVFCRDAEGKIAQKHIPSSANGFTGSAEDAVLYVGDRKFVGNPKVAVSGRETFMVARASTGHIWAISKAKSEAWNGWTKMTDLKTQTDPALTYAASYFGP